MVSSADSLRLIAAASDAHAGMATALFSSGNDVIFSGGESSPRSYQCSILLLQFISHHITGIDRMLKCWSINDNHKELEALAFSEGGCDLEGCDQIDQSSPVTAPEKSKKKKKKSKNSRFTGNDYPMQFSLKWDEEHNEKINVIGGFRVTDENAKSHHIFVGDVSADMTMYFMEEGF